VCTRVCVCECVCVFVNRLGSGFGYKQGQNLGLCVCKSRLNFGVTVCVKSVRFWTCTSINNFLTGLFTLPYTLTLIFPPVITHI
jgi:hypothetical protein